jgi:hypothetical protein
MHSHSVQLLLWSLNFVGEVWPAVPGGGPSGGLPPHSFKLYFKEGGIGTFYPLYYTMAQRAQQAMAAAAAANTPGYGACMECYTSKLQAQRV